MISARPHPRSSERGFTLLEVLLAIALLAIALPVLLGLRNFDLDLQGRAAELTAATLLAQEKLLEIELAGQYPVGETAGEFFPLPFGSQTALQAVPRAVGYRWTRIIAPTPLEFVREVRLKVSWLRGEREESVEVSTYVLANRLPS